MITTLTLNPAFDVHVSIEEFRAGRENLAQDTLRNIGGKGINISLALAANGIQNLPIVLLGDANAEEFITGLKEAGLPCEAILCPGRIRENITIHPAIGEETRLSFKGFRCEGAILEAVEQKIRPGDIVSFTGSLPEGIDAAAAEHFLLRLQKEGSRVVIDSKSVDLPMLQRIKPWLIKPNAEEIEAYCGATTEEALLQAAMELHRGGIENVMISLGGEGAILAAEGSLWRALVPQIEVRSTIGAGDSAIAGFIACEEAPEQRLRRAVAYGSAACLREGTNPPLPRDIARICEQVTITKL